MAYKKRAEHNSVLDWMIHEAAGPLTAISGYAGLAADADEDERQEALKIIASESGRLVRLLGDIRNMACLIRGEEIKIKKEAVDLCGLLREGIAVQKAAAPGYIYTEHFCSDTVTVPGDRDRLMQVVLNLLNNSAKYSERGSEITVSASKNDSCGIFTVADRGCGMTEEELTKIFSLGERLNAPLHTDGRGIGLYLVSELLKAMNGRIDVTSSAGNGSTFTVYLPLH